jgi:uncharacterized delta-60 repeat protein
MDASFGTNGLSVLADTGIQDFPVGVVVQPDGRLLLAGSSNAYSSASPQYLSLARFLASGAPDTTFGSGGRLALPVQNVQATALAQSPDGSVVIAATQPSLSGPIGTVVAKVSGGGSLDSSFGTGGVYTNRALTAFHPEAIAVQPDGKPVLGGTLPVSPLDRMAVLRLDQHGTIDFLTPLDVLPGNASSGRAIALDSKQRIVLAGTTSDPGHTVGDVPMQQAAVARLNSEGSPDVTFAAHGATTFFGGASSQGDSLAILPSDAILVGATHEDAPFYTVGHFLREPLAALFRLVGGDGNTSLSLREALAVEYYHAGFNHYFISAAPYEIAGLDTYSTDWARTGRTFKVWTDGDATVNPVCRFFSDQSFAPKSSHFFTPYPAECASVQAGGVWLFEGTAFYLGLPVGAAGTGTCPNGSEPLYRLYNNGQGGAPNHRYTSDPAIVDQMIAQGWIFEGEAQTRIFACIPSD